MSTIFVSIASYCDTLLTQTIEDALDNARYPDEIRFGVVEQSTVSYADKLRDVAKKQVRLLSVDPRQSRGACWARALVMAMYGDEDWFFQIDAHTIFDKYWDACLLGAWADCARQSKKPYIGGYPHPYEIKDGNNIKRPYTQNIIGNVVTKDKTFESNLIDLPFTPIFVEQPKPVMGFHLAAGCVFAPGNFVYEVPYDPFIYFYGEEPLWALRAYTHGWDLFHVPKLPVYHYYDTGPDIEVKRPRHWAEEEDNGRATRWWDLNNRASQRMKDLIDGKDFGVYGLGRVRTLEDYAAFSGIDYKNRIVHPRAYVGPWHKE
jgi:hypothetical protein